MKKIRNLLIVLIGVLALTGCTLKYETNMNITSDGKVDFGIIAAFDKEMIKNIMSMQGSLGGTTPDTTNPGGEAVTPANPTDQELQNFFYSGVQNEEEAKADAAKVGLTVNRYAEGEFVGYKYTASFNDINAISGADDVEFSISNITERETPITNAIMFKKVGNTYTANFKFDPSDTTDTEDEGSADGTTPPADGSSNAGSLDQYLPQITMDYKFVLTLPAKATTNNATTVSEDGRTLTWVLDQTNITNINFSFDLVATPTTGANGNSGNGAASFLTDEMMMYAGIGGIALILIIVILVVIKSSKKKKAAAAEAGVVEAINEPVNATVDQALESVPSPMPDQTVVEGQPHFESIEVGAPVEAAPAVDAPVDATPVAEAPAEPTIMPVEVAVESPVVEPTVEVPSEPVVETSVETVVETPVEPVVEAPVEPVVEAPVEAVVETPVEPVVEMPVEPGVETSVEVAPVEAVETVSLEMPAEPGVENSVEVTPAVEPIMDSSPVMEMPAEPVVEAPVMDATPAPVMPTEVVETPVAPVEVAPVEAIETVSLEMPVAPAVEPAPAIDLPVVEATPVIEIAPVEEIPTPVMPTEVVETPAVDATPVFETPVIETPVVEIPVAQPTDTPQQ